MADNKTFKLLERFTCHGFYTITGKHQGQLAILPISVNMAVLRIVMTVTIPELGNRKNQNLRTSGNQALKNGNE